MAEKKDMREESMYKKEKKVKKTYFRKGRKLSTCFGCGSHVYWFTE